MRSTFKVLFYVKKGSEKPNGNLPLMRPSARIMYEDITSMEKRKLFRCPV